MKNDASVFKSGSLLAAIQGFGLLAILRAFFKSNVLGRKANSAHQQCTLLLHLRNRHGVANQCCAAGAFFSEKPFNKPAGPARLARSGTDHVA